MDAVAGGRVHTVFGSWAGHIQLMAFHDMLTLMRLFFQQLFYSDTLCMASEYSYIAVVSGVLGVLLAIVS